MYATPALDENGEKIALDFPCYRDGKQPLRPESCGLTLWFSHDLPAEDNSNTVHRHASCDNKHSWFFTGDAKPLHAKGIQPGRLEDDTKGP